MIALLARALETGRFRNFVSQSGLCSSLMITPSQLISWQLLVCVCIAENKHSTRVTIRLSQRNPSFVSEHVTAEKHKRPLNKEQRMQPDCRRKPLGIQFVISMLRFSNVDSPKLNKMLRTVSDRMGIRREPLAPLWGGGC